MKGINKNVYAIIVTYNPDLILLEKCINSLKDQVKKIIIVDNTPKGCKNLEMFKNYSNVEIIHLYYNYGIAYAQNVGIKKALDGKADFILLSDQDTIYPPTFIEDMLICFNDEKVAAAGPLFEDINTNKIEFFVKKGILGFKKIYPKNGKHEVLQLIASGTILNVKYLPDIGLMREELFIDWVDMEWCWRAIKKGYKIIGNADVIIRHKHGENSRKCLTKTILIRKPFRYYYTIRNAVFLSIYTDVFPLSYRIILFFKAIRNAVLFPLLSIDKYKVLKYTLKGFYHGVIKKMGKLDEKN